MTAWTLFPQKHRLLQKESTSRLRRWKNMSHIFMDRVWIMEKGARFRLAKEGNTQHTWHDMEFNSRCDAYTDTRSCRQHCSTFFHYLLSFFPPHAWGF
jgi:hypothetical protein